MSARSGIFAAAVLTLAGCGGERGTAAGGHPDDPPGVRAVPTGTATAQASATAAPAAATVSLALPNEVPHLERHELCREGSCEADISLSPIEPGTQDMPAKMWEHEVANGAKVTFSRDDLLTIIGVVLTGQFVATADDAPKQATQGAPPPPPAFGPLQGFVYRGGGFSIAAQGASSRVLLASVARRGAPLASRGKPWKERPGGQASISRFDLSGPPMRWGGGGFGAVIGLEDAADAKQDASVTLLGISAAAGVPVHSHDGEWELLAILSGGGTMPLGENGEEGHREVKPGLVVAIPKGWKHAFKPSSTPVLAIQLYVPPGPEQRFKKLAAEAPPRAP